MAYSKILIINNPGTSELAFKAPSLGLFSIKHFLKKHGYEVTLIDLVLSNGDTTELFSSVQHNDYAIIGYSGTHVTMDFDIRVLEELITITAKRSWIIVGGVSPTCNYSQWLDIGIDAVVLGFGEYPMLELCKKWNEQHQDKHKNFATVKGIAYKYKGDICVNHANNLSKEIFTELWYDNALEMDIPYTEYTKHNIANSKHLSYGNHSFTVESVSIYSMSQCPNACGYCSAHTFLTYACGKKQPLRMLSAKQLYALTLHNIKKYKAKRISYFDDEFVTSPRRVMDLCAMLQHAKHTGIIEPDIVFACQARVVDFLQKGQPNIPLIEAMRDAKFNHIALGVESFNQHILMTPIMHKPGYDGITAINLLKTMKNLGLEAQANIMLCTPEASINDIAYDISCALELVAHGCAIVVAVGIFAFTGAPVYDTEDYPSLSEDFWIKHTDCTISVKRQFLPFDMTIRKHIEAFPEQFQKVQQQYMSDTCVFSRQLLGIMKLQAFAELLNNSDLTHRCEILITHELARLNALV